MSETEEMSKSEKIRQRILKHAEEGKISVGDHKDLDEFLHAVAEEALEKKAKLKQAQHEQEQTKVQH